MPGPDRSVKRALRDAAPVLFVLALCPIVALMAGGPAVPLERTHRLISAERSLHLFFEPAVYHWFAARPAVMGLADFGYAGIHLPVMLGVLVWIWFARPQAFRMARNTFVLTQALLVAGYVLVPTAPPRMVASLGFDPGGPAASKLDQIAMSPYAAMPSGHAAFAAIAAGLVIWLARNPVIRVIAALYPVAILLEIVGTGNHLWLDAAVGTATAALGLAIVVALESRGSIVRRPWQPSSDAAAS